MNLDKQQRHLRQLEAHLHNIDLEVTFWTETQAKMREKVNAARAEILRASEPAIEEEDTKPLGVKP